MDPDNWPAQLAFETARGFYTREEILSQLPVEREVALMTMDLPEFATAVAEYKRELMADVSPLRMKVKRMLWEGVDNLSVIARDPLVAAADRISAIREMAKLAGLEAREQAANATAVATIQIVKFCPREDERVVAQQ